MSQNDLENSKEERNWRQDKLLTNNEISRLKQGGIDIHELKNGRKTGTKDLYKDQSGNIYIKPKGGQGLGETTGLNINDF